MTLPALFDDFPLVVYLQALPQHGDCGRWIAGQGQRPPKVVQRVGVRQARFSGRLAAAGERSAARAHRVAEISDRAADAAFGLQLVHRTLSQSSVIKPENWHGLEISGVFIRENI